MLLKGIFLGNQLINIQKFKKPSVTLKKGVINSISISYRNFSASPVTLRKKQIYLEAIEPPRLPLTAYFRYQNKYISEATKSTPYRLDPIKLARDASAHWHSMSVEEQQPYKNEYQKDMQHYRQAVTNWWMSKSISKINEINEYRFNNKLTLLTPPKWLEKDLYNIHDNE